MSDSMIQTGDAEAGKIPPSDIWAISAYPVGDDLEYFEFGIDDWKRDTAWARGALAAHGVGRGDHVVLQTPMAESVWWDPMTRGVQGLGGSYSLTEDYSFEAFRALLYVRSLDVRAFIGLSRTVAEALGEDLSELVAAVPLLFCRPDGVGAAEAAGARPFVVTPFGPALALECPERSGVHLNGAEWQVDEGDTGELLLTSLGPRRHKIAKARLGLRGSVVREPCRCGAAGPRVLLGSF